MRCLNRWVALLVLLAIPVLAEEPIQLDSLRLAEGQLLVDFHSTGLAGEKLKSGVQRGLTSEIVYTLQLWQSRPLFSRLVWERDTRVTLFYDNWEGRFAVLTEFEKRLTDDWERVRELCSTFTDLAFPGHSLQADHRYYLVIEACVHPISDQAYHELADWVSGQTRDSTHVYEKNRTPVFDWFVDLLGFGDQKFSHKTPDFYLNKNGVVWTQERRK